MSDIQKSLSVYLPILDTNVSIYLSHPINLLLPSSSVLISNLPTSSLSSYDETSICSPFLSPNNSSSTFLSSSSPGRLRFHIDIHNARPAGHWSQHLKPSFYTVSQGSLAAHPVGYLSDAEWPLLQEETFLSITEFIGSAHEQTWFSCRSNTLRHWTGQEFMVILQDISQVEQEKERLEAIPRNFGLFERLPLGHQENFYLKRDERIYKSLWCEITQRRFSIYKKVVVSSGPRNGERHVAE